MNHVDLYSNDQKGQKYYNRLVLQSNLQVPDHERIGVYSNHQGKNKRSTNNSKLEPAFIGESNSQRGNSQKDNTQRVSKDNKREQLKEDVKPIMVFVNSDNSVKSKHKVPAIISDKTLRDDKGIKGFVEQAEVRISIQEDNT